MSLRISASTPFALHNLMVRATLALELNPQPSTFNPQTSNLNPQFSTLNPQPSILAQVDPVHPEKVAI
jgi:hypothetical protein